MNAACLSRRLTILLSMLLLTTPLMAGKPSGGGGGKPPSSDAVTSTIHDWSPAGTAYRIRSDFSETGSNMYFDGVDGIVSSLPNYYELSALNSPNRRMWVDFGAPAAPGTSVPAEVLGGASAGFVPGRFVSKVGGIADMTGVGSTITGGFPFVFTGNDGKHYQVRMNSANEPGTGDATLTCARVEGADQGDPTAPCTEWVAVPASADGSAIGRLVTQESSKGKTIVTYLGDYVMTFEVSFTRP